MKRLLLFCIVALVIVSCGNRKNEFTLHGTIKNAGDTLQLKISELKQSKAREVATVTTSFDGNFSVTAPVEQIGFYKFSIPNGDYITLIVQPGDKIELVTYANKFGKEYAVYGSTGSRLVKELVMQQNKAVEKIMNLGEVYHDNIQNRTYDYDSLKHVLDSRYHEIVRAHKVFSENFVRQNPQSLASLMALYQSLGPKTPVFNPVEDLPIFELVDSVLREKYPELEAVKALNAEIVKAKAYKKSQAYKEEMLSPGAEAPEIALPNPHGDTVLLSSLRGKYVLVDFWASWCKPCRKENPNLVEVYNKFKNQDFEIYQVSLDKTQEAWVSAIEKDKLDWYHVSDLKFWNSVVVKAYGIEGIPTNFLLDPDGKIIARDIFGPELEMTMNRLFENGK